MASCRLHPIRTGTAALPRGYVYRGEGAHPLRPGRRGPDDRMILPLGAFLVEHPAEGPILIDTGIHPVVREDPRANLGLAGSLIARGIRVAAHENAPHFVRDRGIDPREVRLVVMTHLHVDHTSAMPEFPNATFAIDPVEWRAAHGRLALRNGYHGAHLPPEERVRFVGFDGDGECDLLGDGSLRLVSTPGHTAGHLSVLVETDRGPVFVLGDAVYTLRNLSEDLLPWRTADDDASRATMGKLRAFAQRHPDVPLIPTHDPDVWDAL